MNRVFSSVPAETYRGVPSNEQYLHRENFPSTIEVTEHQEQQAFLNPVFGNANYNQRAASEPRNSVIGRLTVWWFEVVSLLIGVGALAAIIITLLTFNGKEQPAWKYSVNLNTLISILSTLLRVCMLYGVEEALGQMKWLWYRRPRSLRHLDYFDAAGRGPAGSLMLLLKLHKFNSMIIGCLVIIFSVGIGPFTQQAIKSVPCNALATNNSSVQVAQTNSYVVYPRIAAGMFDLELESKAAILQGLANPGGEESAFTADCNTGNCSFPSYKGVTHSSIGFCKKCVDVTSWLYEERIPEKLTTSSGASQEQAKATFNLVLPFFNKTSRGKPTILTVGGQSAPTSGNYTELGWASLPSYFLNITAYENYFPRELEGLVNGAKLDDSFITAMKASVLNTRMLTLTSDQCTFRETRKNDPEGSISQSITCKHPNMKASSYWDTFNAVATTCTFYPCVKEYHAVVNDTVFTETLIRDTPIPIAPGQEDSGIAFPDHQMYNEHCVVDGRPVTLDDASSISVDGHDLNTTLIGGKNVSVPHQCFFEVQGIYLRALTQFLGETLDGGCAMPSTSYFRAGSPKDWTTATCDGWWLKSMYNKGNATFKSIDANMEAVAVAITNKMRRQGSGWDGSPAYAMGTMSRATVCTQFDWIWLSFPVALLGLATSMLLITIFKTLFDAQQVPVWKSSALPLLFTGNGSGIVGASNNIKGVEQQTRESIVRLESRGGSWAFSDERTGVVGQESMATGRDQSFVSGATSRVVSHISLQK